VRKPWDLGAAHERKLVAIPDPPCFGASPGWRGASDGGTAWPRTARPPDQGVDERSPHVDVQVVLTRRAGAEACRQAGELARPVSKVAEESHRLEDVRSDPNG
jgi:hypothetical protein